MNRTVPIAVAGIALIALLAGCTGGPAPDASDDPTAEATPEALVLDLTTQVEPTWTVAADLLGDPASIDGYVGSYVEAADRSMNAVVWDAATGQEMWRDIADPGMGTRGVPFWLDLFEFDGASYATYLRQEMGTQKTELIIADLATGTPVHTIADVFALGRPFACADDTKVCGVGSLADTYSSDQGDFRVDVATGEAAMFNDETVAAGARPLGANIYGTLGRPANGNVEMIGYNSDGTSRWEVPYSDIFGEGYSSDAGYTWTGEGATGLIVGSGFYLEPARGTDSPYTLDETAQKLVGVDANDGSVVWSLPGVATCSLGRIDVEESPGVQPFCRINAGTTEVGPLVEGVERTVTTTGLDMTLVGVNMATGDIEWEVPLGGDLANSVSSYAVGFATGTNPLKLAVVDGVVVPINAVTGVVGDPVTEGTVACSQQRKFYVTYYPHTTGGEREFVAGSDTFPCDLAKTPLAQTSYSPDAIRIAGTALGDDRYLIGGAAGLSMFTVAK
ncbi:hypothetical protein B0I08_101755 [Glaciihabitans tibetensis]|uniref:Pyrroloquinoline-quinone binding quinoprotein n=1 Tax=Glaciihabitans tibetensis TaxID=1266600 RepID=A0A2T0VK80_9MICO|nr:hypothetical protein [Glaciihabitans tibetensis]PRY70618.1 hypothetical protein B0I08_101755 [Glaciihabitans tibetensis]